MTEPLLIPHAAPPAVHRRTGRRGRGATPPVVQHLTADRPNPAGRRTMEIRFRPLERHWDAIRDPFDGQPKSRWRVALNLLWEHFRLIGGFQRADDALVRLVADAFADYDPQQILWALRAKAASLSSADAEERRDKRVFVPRAENFYEARSLDYWIEQSPEGRAAAAERDRRALADKLDTLQAARAPQGGPACVVDPAIPGRPASRPLSPARPAFLPGHDQAHDLAPAIQLAVADQARNTQLLELLGERRRRIAERVVEQDRRDYQWFFDQVTHDEHLTKVVHQHVLARIALDRWPHLRRAYADLGPATSGAAANAQARRGVKRANDRCC